MQRYNNFSNPPNIRRSFFFSRASLVRLTPIIYRSAQIAETPIILYIVPYPLELATSAKETSKQRSNRQNLLTTQGSPDTSEDPFFWVASAKVIHLPQSTKLSTNFFRPYILSSPKYSTQLALTLPAAYCFSKRTEKNQTSAPKSFPTTLAKPSWER